MTPEQAATALRASESELKALGVSSASIFGSVARGESRPESDVDIAVRLTDHFSEGGFAHFGKMEELREMLARMLNCKVDLVEEPVKKQRLQAEIDRDRVFAF